MNKITVIDLLNMISKGEEVPKKIKYRDWLYEFKKNCNDYLCQYDSLLCRGNDDVRQYLNDEVEILEEPRDIEVCGSLFTKSEYDKLAHCEEEKKIPEKLEREIYIENGVEISSEPSIEQIMNKLNEVIDYLKSKGE